MAGPLPFFTPGKPLVDELSSGRLNAIVESVRRTAGFKGRVNDPTFDKFKTATLTCWGQNNSSNDYPEQSILEPYTPTTPVSTAQDQLDFQNAPCFTLVQPNDPTNFPAVTLEPILKNGGIGRIAIGGLAICTVNVTDTDHKYANPVSGDITKMLSGTSGQVRIVWNIPGTTGSVSCVVMLNASSHGSATTSPSQIIRVGSGNGDYPTFASIVTIQKPLLVKSGEIVIGTMTTSASIKTIGPAMVQAYFNIAAIQYASLGSVTGTPVVFDYGNLTSTGEVQYNFQTNSPYSYSSVQTSSRSFNYTNGNSFSVALFPQVVSLFGGITPAVGYWSGFIAVTGNVLGTHSTTP